MKKFTSILLFSFFLLSACSQNDALDEPIINPLDVNDVTQEITPNVAIYVDSAEETAQKIIEAVPNAKVTQKKEDGTMTLALDYKWEETGKIDALLDENATDGHMIGLKNMMPDSTEIEEKMKAQDQIRLVVTLIPVALLEEK